MRNPLSDALRKECASVREKATTVLVNSYANVLKPHSPQEAEDKEVLEKMLTSLGGLKMGDLARWNNERLAHIAATALVAGVLMKDEWTGYDVKKLDVLQQLAAADDNEFAEPLRKHGKEIQTAIRAAQSRLEAQPRL